MEGVKRKPQYIGGAWGKTRCSPLYLEAHAGPYSRVNGQGGGLASAGYFVYED